MRPLDDHIKTQLDKYIASIGVLLDDADTMSIVSPISYRGLMEWSEMRLK